MQRESARQTRPDRPLRVVSYNIHACVGRDGRFAPPRILQVLEALDADIIGLQEVEDRRIHGETVTDYLAAGLSMYASPGPTLNRGEDAYGNLLLTRTAPTDIERFDLSVGRREPRGAISARLDVGGHRINAIVTHFGLAMGERKRQLAALLEATSGSKSELNILMADFNEWRPANGLHRRLRKHFEPCRALRTFPAHAPLLALDRIYVAPHGHIERVHVDRSGIVRVASDHLPLVADLALDASS